MKYYLILLGIILIGCAQYSIPDAPKFPEEVKYHYVVLVADEKALCVRYDIISVVPYKIGNKQFMTIAECDGVGGYKLQDSQKVYNWINEMVEWGKAKCGVI